MESNTIPILSQQLHTFTCPSEIFDTILSYNTKIDWHTIERRGNLTATSSKKSGKSYQSASGSLTEEKDLNDLHQWINQCLNIVVSRTEWRKEAIHKLCVSQSWLNQSEIGDQHHRHSHALSILSGILYLTNHSETKFYMPSIYNLNSTILASPEIYYIQHVHKGTKGELVIFPSTLEHSVDPNLEPYPRVTLSANSWFAERAGIIKELAYVGPYNRQ